MTKVIWIWSIWSILYCDQTWQESFPPSGQLKVLCVILIGNHCKSLQKPDKSLSPPRASLRKPLMLQHGLPRTLTCNLKTSRLLSSMAGWRGTKKIGFILKFTTFGKKASLTTDLHQKQWVGEPSGGCQPLLPPGGLVKWSLIVIIWLFALCCGQCNVKSLSISIPMQMVKLMER